MKDIQYQTKKQVGAEINSKNIVLQEYYNFLNVYLKKESNTLFLY